MRSRHLARSSDHGSAPSPSWRMPSIIAALSLSASGLASGLSSSSSAPRRRRRRASTTPSRSLHCSGFLIDDPFGEQLFDLVESDRCGEEDARVLGRAVEIGDNHKLFVGHRIAVRQRRAAATRQKIAIGSRTSPADAVGIGERQQAPVIDRSAFRRCRRAASGGAPAPGSGASVPSRLPLSAMSTRCRRSTSRCPGGRRRKSRSPRIAASRAAILPCPSSRPFNTRWARRGCWPSRAIARPCGVIAPA